MIVRRVVRWGITERRVTVTSVVFHARRVWVLQGVFHALRVLFIMRVHHLVCWTARRGLFTTTRTWPVKVVSIPAHRVTGVKVPVWVAQVQAMARHCIFIMEVVYHHAPQAITRTTVGSATSVTGYVQLALPSTTASHVLWVTFMTDSATVHVRWALLPTPPSAHASPASIPAVNV